MSKKDTWQQIIKRILWVVSEINSGTFPAVERMANKLNVHPRTIKRMVDGLKQDFNAPIKYSRAKGGYYFRGGSWKLE